MAEVTKWVLANIGVAFIVIIVFDLIKGIKFNGPAIGEFFTIAFLTTITMLALPLGIIAWSPFMMTIIIFNIFCFIEVLFFKRLIGG